MTGSPPSEDDVRAKAYELWKSGGMVHGRDEDDWFRARNLLSPPAAGDAEAPGLLGMLDAAGAVVSAAASAMLGIFSAAPAAQRTTDAPPVAGQAASDAALESAERTLRVEADARIADGKREAATAPSKGSDVSTAKINPDG